MAEYQYIAIAAIVIVLGMSIYEYIRNRRDNDIHDPKVMDYIDLQHEQISLLTDQVRLLNESIDNLEMRQDKLEETINRK